MTYIKKILAESLWQKLSRDGRGFSAYTGFVTISGTAETDFMLITNPADSGMIVRFKEFLLTINATTAQKSIFKFYRSPTVTNAGTEIPVNKVLANGAYSSVLSVSQLPTITDRGVEIQLIASSNTSFSRDQELSRYMIENSTILVTVTPSNTNIEHKVLATWAEEPI